MWWRDCARRSFPGTSDVIIYSGATILGRTRLGRGSIIGANAWVTRDVEPGAIVTRYHGEKDDLRVEIPV